MYPNNPFNNNRFKRILIVEPLADLRVKIARAIQGAGFKVYAVETAESAIQLSSQLGLPHLAIIEIKLPDMSGTELALRLQRHKSIPMIMTGDIDDEHTIAQLLDNLAEDFIRKPFDAREVVARVHRILSRSPLNQSFTSTFPLDTNEQQKYLRARFNVS